MLLKTVPSKNTAAIQGSAKFLRTEQAVSANDDASASSRAVFDFSAAKPQVAHVLPHTDILAQRDLIELYQSIEAALPNRESRVVQFVSCNKKEGSTTIAAGLSTLASSIYGHRTLLIDAYPGSSSIGSLRAGGVASLADVATGRALATNAVALSPVGAMPFDYAYVTANRTDRDILAYSDKFRQILANLRNQYRLIIFHSSNILADPVGLSLTGLTDGVVLVLEAERTRSPAAKRAIRMMSMKGANILGVAFNKRRYYIPRWLYRRM